MVATGVAIAMLAEELGFEYYDREIIEQIAEHTSFSEEYIHQIVEGRRRQASSRPNPAAHFLFGLFAIINRFL